MKSGKGKKGKMNEVCEDWTDIGTIKICGGMTHGQVGAMEAGIFRRLSGVATVRSGVDMPGLNRNRPRVRKPAGARVMLQKP